MGLFEVAGKGRDSFPLAYSALLAGVIIDAYAEFKEHGQLTLPPAWTLVGEFSGRADLHRDEHFGFVARDGNRVVVAIRGTDSFADALNDLDIKHVACPFPAGRSRCARGDEQLYASMRADIGRLVDEALAPGFELWIAGHSLGASMATIAALDLALQDRNPHLVAIAPTRVGDPIFALWFHKHVKSAWRVENPDDLVPKVPPWWLWWKHVGKLHRVKFDHAIGPLENHAIANYRKALLGQEL